MTPGAAVIIAILDFACAPDRLRQSGAERQTVACVAQLDRRPPRGATCSWEWGGDRNGFSTSEVCSGGEVIKARHEYRPKQMPDGLVSVRLAVFAATGNLLVDRTVALEVVP